MSDAEFISKVVAYVLAILLVLGWIWRQVRIWRRQRWMRQLRRQPWMRDARARVFK